MPTGGYSRSDTIGWEDCPLHGAAGWEKSLVQVATQGRRDLALPRAIFGTEELKKTQSQGAAFKRHSKQRKQARCQGQRSPGVRGHCFCRRQPRQKRSQCTGRLAKPRPDPQRGVQVPPHKLSLLDVVLAPSSVSREQSCRSQFSGAPSSPPSIQGWAAIWSREGLSEGRSDRHHSISCWHSVGERRASGGLQLPVPPGQRDEQEARSYTPGETLLRKNRRPRRISSSCSKGISPHTIS